SDDHRKCQPHAERADLRRESEAVGEDEAREGRGCKGVRVERKAAHHDPGAKQAEADRQQEDLEHAALDEGKLKRVEQGFGPPQASLEHEMIMGIILIWGWTETHVGLTGGVGWGERGRAGERAVP